MNTVDDLTKYFGYYKTNADFLSFVGKEITDLSEYDEITSYQVGNECKIEIGYTNERMIRESDKDKPLTGGQLIFTHFNLKPLTVKLIKRLPFGITFSDKVETVRVKAGPPAKIIEEKLPILGLKRIDSYEVNGIRISIDYSSEGNIKNIQIGTTEMFIREETRPTHNKAHMP